MTSTDEPKRPLPADVQRLHALGVSRNGIARELDVSTRQVDNAVRALGLTFSAAGVEDAVKARAYRADKARAEIADNLRDVALRESRKAMSSQDALETSRHVKAAVDALQAERGLDADMASRARERAGSTYPPGVDDAALELELEEQAEESRRAVEVMQQVNARRRGAANWEVGRVT